MSSEWVSTRQLTELLPYSFRHIADKITHLPTFPAARRAGSRRFWSRTAVTAWWVAKKES